MKILVINWRCIKNPEMGGAEVHLHEIFKRVVSYGHEVTLVAHNFKGAKKEEIIDGIKIKRIGNKWFFNLAFKKYYLLNLKKRNFDLVVDDISKIPLNTPNFINLPLVAIIHHIHGDSLYSELPFPLAKYIINKEKEIPYVYSQTPFFTVSPSTRSELIDMGVNSEKIDLLYNAINHNLYKNTDVRKFENPTITYIGRIKKYKQIEKVIDVIPLLITEFPNLQFRIGGRGDYENTLKKIVKERGLENYVKFLGFLSEKEKAEELGKAWVFVTLAMKEGWGITVIEANAMGTPVIGSNVQGLRDSIRDYETGFLVNMNNRLEVADKISKLLRDENLRKEFSRNAISWSEKFTWDNSAKHFLQKVTEWFPNLGERK